MARSMKKTTSTTSTAAKTTKPVENKVEETEEIVETKEIKTVQKEKKVEKKVFSNDDMIPCMSIMEGKLVLVGSKTNDVYRWVGIGDVQEVAYNDLIADVRSRGSHTFAPWFIIQDKDFLAQHPEVDDVYAGLYTPQDIENVLSMPANQMKSYLEQMPIGAQDSLKNMAVTRIESGEFDSIQRIKVLDEFFGTNLLVALTN